MKEDRKRFRRLLNKYNTLRRDLAGSSLDKLNRQVSGSKFGVQSPVFVSLEISGFCTYRCTYCLQGTVGLNLNRQQKSFLPLKTIIQRIDSICETEVACIIVTGGEPSLHPELAAIVTHIKSKGVAVTVESTGEGLTKETLSAFGGILIPGGDLVKLNINALNAATHARITGAQNFEFVMSRITLMRNLQIPFAVNTVVTSENLEEVHDLVKYVLGSGAQYCSISVPFFNDNRLLKGNLAFNQVMTVYETLLNDDSIKLRILLDFAHVILGADPMNNPDDIELKFNCAAGLSSCAVNYNGDTGFCHYMLDSGTSLGNIDSAGFRAVWDELHHVRCSVIPLQQHGICCPSKLYTHADISDR